VLRGGGGAQRGGGRLLVPGSRLLERPIHQRPEAPDGGEQPLLLRGRTLGGCQALLGPDRLVEVSPDPVERLPPRRCAPAPPPSTRSS
jgi:hypothetical protein